MVKGVSNQRFSLEISDSKQDFFLINFGFEARLSLLNSLDAKRDFSEGNDCEARLFVRNLRFNPRPILDKFLASKQDFPCCILVLKQTFFFCTFWMQRKTLLANVSVKSSLFLQQDFFFQKIRYQSKTLVSKCMSVNFFLHVSQCACT